MRVLCFIFAIMFGAVAPAYAQKAPIYTSWQNNLAVGGYDTVSFFSGSPVQGKEAFSYIYNNAEWRFQNRGNLEVFKTNPEVFMPQYGGYCAWAVAMNKLAKGSPKYWHVEDGKLYLNFNGRIKRRWGRNLNEFVAEADENWPEILQK